MNFKILLASFLVVLFLVIHYSCGTANDPILPKHPNTSTNNNKANSITISGVTYLLDVRNCAPDTTYGGHYVMKAANTASNLMISLVLYDYGVPADMSSYLIVKPHAPDTLLSGQCFFIMQDTISPPDPAVGTTGTLSISINNGAPNAIISQIAANRSDTTKTFTGIFGNFSCN